MKWSELSCENRVYGQYTENEMIARGWFLYSLGIDLDSIPDELFDSCEHFSTDGVTLSNPYEDKIHIRDVVGTTRQDYSGGTWLDAFLQEHKVLSHLQAAHVSRGKYFHMLKRHINAQAPCIHLIKSKNGKYYVYRNGNHRVTFYKLMYLAECATHGNRLHYYWLYANIYDEL